MPDNRKTKLSRSGKINAFTLVEVLLALAVIAIGLMPLLHLLTKSILTTDSAWNLSQAVIIADTVLAEAITAEDLKVDTRKGSVESRDREFNFDWQTQVSQVDITELEGADLAGLYKATVTVMWQEGRARKQVFLTRYVFIDKTRTETGDI